MWRGFSPSFARVNAFSDHRPIPVSASGVMLWRASRMSWRRRGHARKACYHTPYDKRPNRPASQGIHRAALARSGRMAQRAVRLARTPAAVRLPVPEPRSPSGPAFSLTCDWDAARPSASNAGLASMAPAPSSGGFGYEIRSLSDSQANSSGKLIDRGPRAQAYAQLG